jgi:lysophospholipase L1-like esterase
MRSKLVSSGIRLLFLGFLTLTLFFGEHFGLRFEYAFSSLFDNIYVRLAKCCLFLLLLIEFLRLYYYGIVKNPKPVKWLGNVATLLVPLVLLVVFLEMAFMFVEQSQEGGMTLASHIWFERHWPPVIPELNYRDTYSSDTLGKKKVLLLGDSFTAGHGVKLADDRFGNVLGQKLGNQQYAVYNLGILGSDTGDEYKRLTQFPVKPNVLVLQYFPNDVERVAGRHGLNPAGFEPYSDLPRAVQTLFRKSYLLNYLYWQFPHGNNFGSFDEYCRKAYGTPAIINEHLNELGQIMNYARQHNAQFYVVLFPFLNNIAKSTEYTKPVVDFFARNNVPVLNVGKLVSDLKPEDRIVGRNDAHASPVVNQRVGNALYELMQSNSTLTHIPSVKTINNTN